MAKKVATSKKETPAKLPKVDGEPAPGARKSTTPAGVSALMEAGQRIAKMTPPTLTLGSQIGGNISTSTARTHTGLVLDASNSPFEAQIIKMVEIHRKKKADYAGDDHPNANFYDTAHQLAATGGHAVEALIATKQARLRVLLPQFWKKGKGPLNEGIYDTLLDRAVYAVIALTIWSEDGYEQDHPNQKAAG